jgi:hypothetical protein
MKTFRYSKCRLVKWVIGMFIGVALLRHMN